MCGGHGQCHYYGSHEDCNNKHCSGTINKLCVCNKNSGFYEYPHGGGTCTHSTPGAKGGAYPDKDESTRPRICYARGKKWGSGKMFGKDQGAYMRVPPNGGKKYLLKDPSNSNNKCETVTEKESCDPVLDDNTGLFEEVDDPNGTGDSEGNGPTSICTFCEGTRNYDRNRPVPNGAPGGSTLSFMSYNFVGPDSCMATDQRTPGHTSGEKWSPPTGSSKGSNCNTNSPIARSTVGQRCGNVFSGAFRCECHEGGADKGNAKVPTGKNMARLLTRRHGFSTNCAGSSSLQGLSSTPWQHPFEYDNAADIARNLGGCGYAHHKVDSWKKCW